MRGVPRRPLNQSRAIIVTASSASAIRQPIRCWAAQRPPGRSERRRDVWNGSTSCAPSAPAPAKPSRAYAELIIVGSRSLLPAQVWLPLSYDRASALSWARLGVLAGHSWVTLCSAADAAIPLGGRPRCPARVGERCRGGAERPHHPFQRKPGSVPGADRRTPEASHG